MSDTYEAFYNGKPLNPNRGLPTMSYAQAEDCGLTDSERLWCRTDGDGTVITADEVPYDSNNSVKDKIDDIGFKKLNPTSAQQDITVNYSNCVQIDKTVFVDMLITTGSSSANNRRLVSGLPETVSNDNFQFWGIEVKAYPNFSTTPIGFRIYNANNSGGIYPNTAISAGQYHVYGMYITN